MIWSHSGSILCLHSRGPCGSLGYSKCSPPDYANLLPSSVCMGVGGERDRGVRV